MSRIVVAECLFACVFASIAQAASTRFYLQGESSEVSGAINGSVVTPSIGPAGTLVINGAGSASFVPAQISNGVNFKSCCSLSNTAYYKFTGAQLGNVFNAAQPGSVTFYLKSLKSWAQRQADSNYRMVFNAEANTSTNNNLYYFYITPSSGRLLLAFNAGATGSGSTYYVPAGQEDAIFGNGVILKVSISWDGSKVRLALNDNFVTALLPYTPAAANWTTSSIFVVGGDNYTTSGAFHIADDMVIDDFTITGTASASDTTPPRVSITAPSDGATVSGVVTVSATATDDTGVTSVQFQLDSVNLNSPVTTAPYTTSWNTAGAANGAHTLKAIATDAAGNNGISTVVNVTVNNTSGSQPPVISAVAASTPNPTSAVIAWTTDQPADSQVDYGLTTSYGSSTPLDSSLVTSHSVTVSGLNPATTYHYEVKSRNSSGALATSADFTFTTPAQGTPIPAGTWTMVKTNGVPEQAVGWEKLVYAPILRRSVMWSKYHQGGSEPNMSMLGYNFETNTWDLLDMGGRFHNENMPEGGHSVGAYDFNPNNNTLIYRCCNAGSNQPENPFHTWWYDLTGQSGRDKHTSPKPIDTALQPGGAFDAAHNVFIFFGGDSFVGTWIYDPVANTWRNANAGGAAPDPSLILASMTYNSHTQQVYLFGGVTTSYSAELYAYDFPSNTWSHITPQNGVKPPPRYRAGFAYDSTNNIFLLYGGHNDSGDLGDTWVYDPAANTWTQLNPPQSPPVAWVQDNPPLTIPSGGTFERMAYDSDHNVFVLLARSPGGYAGGDWTTYAIQTWFFRYGGPGPNAGFLSSPNVQPSAGSLNISAQGWAKEPSIATSGNSVYVTWTETGVPFDTSSVALPHIYAKQFTSGAWSQLGTYTSISSQQNEAHAPESAVVGGAPWVVWYEFNNSTLEPQLFARSWDGANWNGGGAIGLVRTPAYQGRSQLLDVGGIPHIAYIEVDKSTFPQSAFAYVRTWNGSSWILKGTGALNRNAPPGSLVDSISIATDGTQPFVAWTEYVHSPDLQHDTNPQVYVSSWNGSQWNPIGGSLNVNATNWAYDASIAVLGGQPYIAWTERTQSGNAQLYVKTWNGTAWVLVGSGSLNKDTATGWAYRPSLIADAAANTLYLAWVEQLALGQKAQAFVLKYSAGVWTNLAQSLNADPVQGSAQRVRAALFNGQPLVAWTEVKLGAMRQLYVKQWNGSAWAPLAGNIVTGDTTPPAIPTNVAATAVSATQISVSWSATTDDVGVAGYRVYRNGVEVANVTSGLSYTDSGLAPLTSYSYTVAAYDAAGNTSNQSTAAVATTMAGSGDTTPPVISGASANVSSSTAATITWTTDEPSDSQVDYGTTTAYGLSSTLNSSLVTSHTVNLSGLTPATGYHYQVKSRDAAGNLAVLPDFTFTTQATQQPTQTLLYIAGESTELSGMTNGSTVTPNPGPTGTLVINGGSVNFAPAQIGNGVNFQNCCGNTNNAYYRFTGAALGNIFNASQAGSISFYLKSLKSWTQRQASPSMRMIFNAEADTSTNSNLYYFYVMPSSNRLLMAFNNGSASGGYYYYIPAGQEDAMFGNGVILKVKLLWDGANVSMYLNDVLVQSPVAYTPAAANWAASSTFIFGGDNYLNAGVYNVADDMVIDEFTVSGFVPAPDTTPPSVSITTPTDGSTISGSAVNVTATAADNVGVASVQFQLDGTNLGSALTSSPYTMTWNTIGVSNGAHALTAIAKDAAGNTTTSAAVNVTVNNVVDTTPPTVSITAPTDGSTVSGSVSVTATAADNVGVASVQFQLDGTNLGSALTSAPYTTTWNTATAVNGAHVLTAIAKDASANATTSTPVNVTVNNVDTTPPVISAVTATAGSSTTATITWTTDEPSDSQVDYGPTSAYGNSSPLNSSLVTAHSLTISGLTASTSYHYQVKSRDGSGNLAVSGDFSFTTPAPGPQPVLYIAGESTELSGTTNGSIVTPNPGPAGTLVINGAGSVNFVAAQVGNGVNFHSCCSNTNNAYYRFTGPALGNIFKASQAGSISFYLKSLKSWTQRQASSNLRMVFNAEADTSTNSNLYYFYLMPSSNRLLLAFNNGSTGGYYYYIPAGQEDAMFGNGVVLKVKLSWDGANVSLYLNDVLAQGPIAYTAATANWTASSTFILGGDNYLNSGVYSVADDMVIDEFTVGAVVPAPDTTPPTVAITAPTDGSTVSGSAVAVTATAADNVGVASVQFQLDGTNLGSALPSAPYTMTWNTIGVNNGIHVLTAIAKDAAANTATSAAVNVTVNNVVDTTPPTVSITAPADGSTVSGSVSVTATATDNVGVASVQFQLDGTNLGSALTSAPYTMTWNTATATNGAHVLTAIAKDASTNATTSTPVNITINNVDTTPPVISAVLATAGSSTTATITWTTDEPSDSQVDYGPTSAYGSSSTLNASLVTTHSVTISGLTAASTYHYHVKSRDGSGNLAVSGDFNFATPAPGPQPVLYIAGEPAEVSGTTNGSTVTPNPGPTGTLVINGAGSVNFVAAQVGNGVNFQSCCGSTNNAYYRFTGPALGNIFKANQAGSISFYLKSLKTWAQRQASASMRMVFNAEADTSTNSNLYYFYVMPASNRLLMVFNNGSNSGGYAYYIPAGQEDALFGNGVTLKVKLSWDGANVSMYLNDNLVQGPVAYTPATANWTASSTFIFGGDNYLNAGVYNVADDMVIDEFTVSAAAPPPDTIPPTISITVPTDGSTVSGSAVTLTATASDNIGVASVQFQLDGTNLGSALTTAPYRTTWNTIGVTNGTHVLTAIAKDAAANLTTSAAVNVTVNNIVDTTPPAVSITAPADGSTVSGSAVNVTATATDNVGVASVQFQLDGANLGSALTSAPYTVTWNTIGVTNGTHVLTAIAKDAANNAATSAAVNVAVNNVPDTTPPTVSITAPADGSTVSGSVNVTATAADNVGVASVQFQLDGSNLGSPLTSAPYTLSWNTIGVTNGTHALTAIAKDAAANTTTSTPVNVTVNNVDTTPPVISAVSAAAVSSTSAMIAWTTDKASDSQVDYGPTTAYGSSSPLNSSLVTTHSAAISGLAASTTYHYYVKSRDGSGNLAVSNDFTFTMPALYIAGEPAEAPSLTTGASVTPTIGPPGTVVINGSGSVNFAAAQVGSGVNFQSCCSNTNNAYYRFTGPALGNVFNASQAGSISFYLKSLKSWTQRQASPSMRMVFNAEADTSTNSNLYYFYVMPSSNRLLMVFNNGAASGGYVYYIPAGQEDAMFGNGVTLKVKFSWDGAKVSLYLNDNLVQSPTAYTPATANWTASSTFIFGGDNYLNTGVYNVADDMIIDEFTVIGIAPAPDTTPPAVSITAPADGSTVSGSAVSVTATATDNVAIASVQFQLDGTNLASPLTSAPYTLSWNTVPVANGTHALTAIARDTSGNATTSSVVNVTVNNVPDTTPPVISGVSAATPSPTSATITWTTDESSDSQVDYGTTTVYGSSSTLGTSLVTSHTVTVSGLTASTGYHYQVKSRDAAGNLAVLADFTFTTPAVQQGPQPTLYITGEPAELSGTTNGSTVTPTIGPAGTLVVTGSGSVNFAAAQVGNGVNFHACCSSTNTAYYRFTGTALGSIFNASQAGSITFYLKSLKTWAQRQTDPNYRMVFNVEPNPSANSNLYYFYVMPASGRLLLAFNNGSTSGGFYYYIPAGQEDAIFGNGATLKVKLSWNGASVSMYLNDNLVQGPAAYTAATSNWTASSAFVLGGKSYLNAGVFNAADDVVIDEFTVTPAQ